jgi:S-adenosylmethionine synthetase
MAIHIGPNGVEKEKIIVIKKNIKKNPDHEIIERKGIGHPDTICDALASRLSQKYSEYTIKNCDGRILHHQFDKVMLIGGRTDVTWGGGRFINPIQVNVVGRITKSYLGKKLPTTKLVNNEIEEFFLQMFPQVDIKKDIIMNLSHC